MNYFYTKGNCNYTENFKKNGIVCKDIKTKKAQEQDWNGTCNKPLPHMYQPYISIASLCFTRYLLSGSR